MKLSLILGSLVLVGSVVWLSILANGEPEHSPIVVKDVGPPIVTPEACDCNERHFATKLLTSPPTTETDARGLERALVLLERIAIALEHMQ